MVAPGEPFKVVVVLDKPFSIELDVVAALGELTEASKEVELSVSGVSGLLGISLLAVPSDAEVVRLKPGPEASRRESSTHSEFDDEMQMAPELPMITLMLR